MKVELMTEGYWLASGMGITRQILAEGGTRAEALYNWRTQFNEQKRERKNKPRAV